MKTYPKNTTDMSFLKIDSTHWPVGTAASLLLAVALLAAGCGVGNDAKEGVEAERDSLKALSERQRQDLQEINGVISVINAAFDSIAIAEGLLFGDSHSEVSPTRKSVLANLEMFEQVLQRQHAKIAELDSLVAAGKASEGMKGLVEHMKEQLADKDAQLATLRRELADRNVDISRLRRQVASQRSVMARQEAAINELDARNGRQATALTRQDQEINSGYIMIGTKAELKQKGVARRRKIIGDGLKDLSKFTKVDIRRTTELTFTAKKPRVLTDMPQSAYSLTETGKRTYTLKITDPARFWGASRVLVIQTN